MYLFYGINEDNMWPNAEGRLIHFTNGVFRVTNAIFMIPPARTKKNKKPRNECFNINDLITFV